MSGNNQSEFSAMHSDFKYRTVSRSPDRPMPGKKVGALAVKD